jgi:hypothetical protein
MPEAKMAAILPVATISGFGPKTQIPCSRILLPVQSVEQVLMEYNEPL